MRILINNEHTSIEQNYKMAGNLGGWVVVCEAVAGWHDQNENYCNIKIVISFNETNN